MPEFQHGRELARAFYEETVAPIVAGRVHTAALIGYGSEVFGFDSHRSTDHGWGPRFQLFVAGDQVANVSREIAAALPRTFRGWPTHFGWDETSVGHHVEIAELGDWLEARLGVNPVKGLRTADWLSMPHQRLAEVTAGPVFHDDSGVLSRVRSDLAWYPDQVWIYVLASQWRRIAQEEAFVGRAAEAGDELGSRLLAGRLVRDLVRLCFLLERRYPPYSKWLGTAFAQLASAEALQPTLQRALSAASFGEREAALVVAYRVIGARHNSLGITPAVDAEPRPYYGRPYLVSAAGDFVAACLSCLKDPWLVSLTPVGSVDQFADSTDVLTCPQSAARVTKALLLEPSRGPQTRTDTLEKRSADPPVRVRPLVAEDAAFVCGILERRWGGVEIISRGHRHDASRLPGLLALDACNEACGLLTWRVDGKQREVVSLDAFPTRQGIGSALLRALEAEARTAGVRRLWLITTNDNVSAIAFYQRVGWRLYAVHRDALAEARRLRPSIPLTSPNGVPIRDEVELERVLDE